MAAAVYDGASSTFRMLSMVTSQLLPPFFAVQHDVTGNTTSGYPATSGTHTLSGGGIVNTTLKPVFVSVKGDASSNTSLILTVDGTAIAATNVNEPNALSVSGIVPAGSTYTITQSGATITVSRWVETY